MGLGVGVGFQITEHREGKVDGEGISWAGREKRELQPGMESWARGASEGKLRKSEMGTDSEVLWVWGLWMR